MPCLASLVGCTGAGKTAVALEVVRLLRHAGRSPQETTAIEIVSADSRQVYRGLDVGTAKPTPAERAQCPHHLVDVVGPEETYTAARYGREARAAFEEIRGRGAVPFLVGGSGLYVRAAEEGLFEGPAADDALRGRLAAEAKEKGAAALHARLAEVDPETAKRLHPRDKVRVIRALEVWESTGVAISEHHRRHREAAPAFQWLRFGVQWPVAALDARIAARAEAMLAGGWVEEVERLRVEGVSEHAPGMNAVGYPEVAALAAGKLSRGEALAAIVRATRQFAKRQRTWFRAVPEIEWLRVEREEDLPVAAARVAEAMREQVSREGAFGE
ncbi:MAG: tRNA (adenosine(37)-N6)-dimethylallyltransferase MiaA [bacterium]